MTAVPVPSCRTLEPPPWGVASTKKALPAGAEPASRFSSKVTVSVVPSTVALAKAGGLASFGRTSRATAASPNLSLVPSLPIPWTTTSWSFAGSRPVKVCERAEASVSISDTEEPPSGVCFTCHLTGEPPVVAGVQVTVISPWFAPGAAMPVTASGQAASAHPSMTSTRRTPPGGRVLLNTVCPVNVATALPEASWSGLADGLV